MLQHEERARPCTLHSKRDPNMKAPRRPACRVVPCFCLFFVLLFSGDLHAFRLGNTSIIPSLALYGTYDDNVLLRSEDDPEGPIVDDWIGRILPGVLVSRREGSTNFSLSYQNEFLLHRELKEQDVKGSNHSAMLSAAHSFGERTSIAISDRFRIGTEVSSISEVGLEDITQLGILPRSGDYLTNGAGIQVDHALTRRLRLSGLLDYQYQFYEAVQQAGVELEPKTENHLGSVRTVFSYAVHPRNSLMASVGFSYNDYDQQGRSRIYLASLGDSWQLTESLSLSGSGGIEYLEEENELEAATTTDTSIHPYAEFGATYGFQDFRFLFSFLYGLEDSSGLGTTVSSRSVRFGVDYMAWERFTAHAYGFYSKSKSAGQIEGGAEQDIESIQGGGSLDYRLQSWISARLEYNFIDQDASGVSGGSYKDNRVLMGFVLSIPDRM